MDLATTLTPERIDKRLRILERGIASLPADLQIWSDSGPDPDERTIRQAAFRAEWADLMDRFDSLARHHAKGLLSDGQAGRLREIASALAAATSDLERLGLRLPLSTEARGLVEASGAPQPRTRAKCVKGLARIPSGRRTPSTGA